MSRNASTVYSTSIWTYPVVCRSGRSSRTHRHTQQIFLLSVGALLFSPALSIIPLLLRFNQLQMRLSSSYNVLILSTIYRTMWYSESLTHYVFTSLYPSVSRTVCHVTCVTISSAVASFLSAWQPWNIWTLVTVGLSADRHCISVGIWRGWRGGGVLLTERIRWAGKDIHSAKALKSVFIGWTQIPSHSTALSGSNEPVLDRFLAGPLLGPAGRDRDLTFPASKRGAYVKTTEWLTTVKKERRKKERLRL